MYAFGVNVSNNSSIHLNNDKKRKKKKEYSQLFQFAFHSKWRTFFVWNQDFIGTILEPNILAKRLNRWYCNLNKKNCTHLVINIKNIFVNNFNFLIYKNENSKKKSCCWTINDNPK